MSDALHDLHLELDELFLMHQECLIGLELETAQERLAHYAARVRQHIEVEDRVLFPLYAERVQPAPRGGPAGLFLDEHRKIERLLEEAERFFEGLTRDAGHPRIRRGVLALLEREATLAHVLEHHHLREEEVLMPALLGQIGAEGVRELVAQIARETFAG